MKYDDVKIWIIIELVIANCYLITLDPL